MHGFLAGILIVLVLYTNNIFIFLINVYGYNSSNENRALFEVIENKIALWLNKYQSGLICIGGDFNIAPDNMLDLMPPKNTPCNLLLKTFMEKYDLIDIWRQK